MTSPFVAREKEIQKKHHSGVEMGLQRQRKILQKQNQGFSHRTNHQGTHPWLDQLIVYDSCPGDVIWPVNAMLPSTCHLWGHLDGVWFCYKSWVSNKLKDRYFPIRLCLDTWRTSQIDCCKEWRLCSDFLLLLSCSDAFPEWQLQTWFPSPLASSWPSDWQLAKSMWRNVVGKTCTVFKEEGYCHFVTSSSLIFFFTFRNVYKDFRLYRVRAWFGVRGNRKWDSKSPILPPHPLALFSPSQVSSSEGTTIPALSDIA